MYQEVDLIDIALGSARKQCDDAKERANRLSVTVDRLRDALSRFMSKVRPGRPAAISRPSFVRYSEFPRRLSACVCPPLFTACFAAALARCFGKFVGIGVVVCCWMAAGVVASLTGPEMLLL